MLHGWGMLGVYMLVAILILASMLLIPWALTLAGIKPQHPGKVKNDTYECGVRTVGGSWVRFNFRYYYYALSFLVFDIEAVFLIPWAVRARVLHWWGLGAAAVFVAVITIGLIYEWRKKALEWN